MRCIVIGLGIQGSKRKKALEACGGFYCTVDPVNKAANYINVESVPVQDYDAAMVCVPTDQKPGIVEYLATNKKHMLIEKPLLEGHGWKIELFDRACKANGVIAYVAYNHRFEPMIIKLKELIDSGDLGKLYHCRMFYGNGTAENVKGAWRDREDAGVVSEVGTHLIDLSYMLFGPVEYKLVNSSRHENERSDHAVIISRQNPVIECECTYLSWKNTFTIDIIGSNGSAHLDGLTKWGASRLTQRWRRRPPGVPFELMIETKRPDVTWEKEYYYFDRLCGGLEANPGFDRDIMINKALEAL